MMIPYGRQDIQDSDIEAVLAVLKSDHLTQGPIIPNFENAVKRYCKSKHAVAVNSATSALHISLLALGVGEGDCVWTSPNTFVATANSALYCGADVDFVDIDPHTYNISVQALSAKLETAAQNGSVPKVVIPVHLTGQPCDMHAIYALSVKYGFYIVEDASHAIGGRYLNGSIGNCEFSDITVFSFHPVKIVTTGEGGMALTNDSKLAQRLQLFRSHGVTRDPDLMTREVEGPWYYQQVELGYNYRMTDLQAALGLSQMERLDDYIKRRHAIAECYNNELENIPFKLPQQMEFGYSAYHLYVIRVNSAAKVAHKAIFEELRENGIMVNLHYIPVHTQPYYQKLGFRVGDYPEAEAYYREAISLPMYPTLSDDEQGYVIRTLQKIMA